MLFVSCTFLLIAVTDGRTGQPTRSPTESLPPLQVVFVVDITLEDQSVYDSLNDVYYFIHGIAASLDVQVCNYMHVLVCCYNLLLWHNCNINID